MGTPIVVLAGQSNAGRIAGEIIDALNETYGAGNYVLVRAHSSGAPLTSARDGKTDWETPGEMRAVIVDETIAALLATPDGYVAGVIWVQGEGDTDRSGTPADYAPDFHDLMGEFRAGVASAINRPTGVENAPIVISGLSDHAPAASERLHWDAIQAELIRLGADNPGIVTVRPDPVMAAAGIAPAQIFSDGLHYSDPASVVLADSLVAALLDMQVTGTGGADTLVGTAGNDVFVVDHPGDIIIEEEDAGIDLVRSSVDFELRTFGLTLENLTLTGTADLSGTGNGLDNVLTGNSGDNALNGAWGNDVIYGMAGDDTLQDTKGNDTLVGGTGNDVYYIDSPDDVVIELPGEGHDRINTSVTFRMWADAPEVEDLVLTGSDTIDGIGNAWNNHITGNGAANYLDGARGHDLLEGGGGADTLLGQSGADTLLGQAGDDVLYGDQMTGASTTYAGMAFRLYQATLARAPDANGYGYWTEQLANGANYFNVIAGFVHSPEFQATYGNLTDEAFVEMLYQNVLNRASDAAGKAVWMGYLEDGQSREFVVSHFAESPEFKQMMEAELARWTRALGPDDVLDPGAGDSTLSGGDLSDTFVFAPASDGTHVITDFESWDTLDLRGFGYADTADALAEFRQQGDDLVFQDAGVTVVLQDTTVEDLGLDTLLL
ncbi:Hemolysin-type calcium-binding repeat-containing protein [Mameliella alba]|uniref:DUF4214 domain-containing protein n=1 Tax=Mameliella alba TaxID=561184 RepID=UPI000891987C|nr:DUF4214 domain-containing protein [Mameliella alba]PTR42383.1 hemolysin type calcium-binding protein [Mameliella alba]GGF57361.1 hypothetical protein GCM10011319_18290 [Mameliella alba]SDC08382.1 Hemolysin-type calcium-binding repeat-containing protein [Mameliella alba]